MVINKVIISLDISQKGFEMKKLLIAVIFIVVMTSNIMANNQFSLGNKQVDEDYVLLTYYINQNQTGYKIFIASPIKMSQKRLPVIYMLDANKQFPIAFEKIKESHKEIVLVGIGYQDDSDDFIKKTRFQDYTPYAQGDDFREGGKAKEFYDFIQNRVKPWINSQYPIDQHKQTLIGHSLGGLFVLYSLFLDSNSFNNYIAASPSLWWGYGVVVPNRERLLTSCPDKIILSEGEKEKDSSQWTKAEQAFLGKYQGVITTEQLYSRLQSQCKNVEYKVFKGKNHRDSIPDAISLILKLK